MKQIILDFSGGNTHQNKWTYLNKMIDSVKKLQGKLKDYEFIIKHQLFMEAVENKPMHQPLFTKAYEYAKELGIKSTASVFDRTSLDFLLTHEVPFIKIANNRDLDYLIDFIPRGQKIYLSLGSVEELKKYQHLNNAVKLLCVSKYPANIIDYDIAFGGPDNLSHYLKNGYGLSDHTTSFGFYILEQEIPDILEVHYVLEHDENNPDGGSFARTPEDILNALAGESDG